VRASTAVVAVTIIQAVFLGPWIVWNEPGGFSTIWANRRIVLFIGIASAVGSIGWFTAMAMQNASYVKAVGQVEAIFTLAISRHYFGEHIRPIELAGVVAIIAGILIFFL